MRTLLHSPARLATIVLAGAFLAALMPSGALAGSCVPPTAGLVSWWPGDGDALDYASTNNGTATGGVSFPESEVAQGFGLNGTSAFIQVPAAANLDPIQGATFEAWVYLDKLPSVAGHHMSIMAKSRSGNDFDLQADTDNHFRFYLAGAAVGSTSVIQTGRWYHVAGTYAAKANLGLYVNGALEAVKSYGGTRTANGTVLQIGASAVWAGRYFSGRIDEAALYDRALAPDEVAAIYTAGTNGRCKSPTVMLQPQDVLLPAGQGTTFSVSLCGAPPLGYQWLFKGTNLADVFPIGGSQTKALAIANAQYANGGSYHVVVTNSLGSCTSAPGELTVFAPTAVAWTDWTSAIVANPGGSATGILTSGPVHVAVSYSGEVFSTTQTNGAGVNYYLPVSTYTNAAVTNPPVKEMITFVGGSTTNTLTFSPPLPYPIFALVSLGSPGINVDLAFNAPFSILSTGPGSWGSGPPLTQTSNTLNGAESDGLIRFNGTFSSISWTVSPGDTFYNGFTVGAFASLLFPLNARLHHDAPGAVPRCVLSWGHSGFPPEAFSLQAATNVAGPYNPVPGATSPYTNTADSRQLFFRLKAN